MRATMLVYLLLLPLIACSSEPQPLIRIDGSAISLDEFRLELRPLQNELVQLPPEQQKLLLRQALSQLIDQKLLLTESRKRGISVDATELQQEIESLRGNYTDSEYREMLAQSGQNPDAWIQQLGIRLLGEKVASSITRGKIRISDKQVEEFYLQHLEDYRHPELLQARQILLQSEQQANLLRNRLLSGESFAKLAAENSLSPDREAGGDLGLFERGQLPPEFDAVLFELTPGRVSPPVKSPYGVHLFLVEKKLKAGVTPLVDVTESIRKKLQGEEELRLYQQWLQDLREQTEVLIDWEQLDKIHFDKAR